VLLKPHHYSHTSCLGRFSKDKSRYRRYSAALKQADSDINRSFDVTNLIQRFRSHGLALRLMLDTTQQKEVAVMAKTKSIDEVKRVVTVTDEWDEIEG